MPRCSGPSSLMVDGAGGLTCFLFMLATSWQNAAAPDLAANRREVPAFRGK